MDTLTPIFERIKRKETRYKEKTLVGLIDITPEEYALVEKQAEDIMVSYKNHPYLYHIQSDILSLYAILFDMYAYTGERFWESLAMRLGLDEKYVRDIIVEAMKISYENRCWSFYQTTRNEYVETIRMHGVIGNDSSGDKIIYVLYVIYLKDFEKEVTKEKLDLFFPYLRKIFRKYEGSVEENATNYELNGIAYIRGQIPKSFMHAYLLNPSAVATVLRKIFNYFEWMESGNNEPIKINERFENKIRDSLKRNNGFENEYTRAYILKKPKQMPLKDRIEYQRRAVHLHVPTHFIDFQPNEEPKVVLNVFNFQHKLKTIQLNISMGGIGWKSEPVDLTFGAKHKNLRYTIEKPTTKEKIFDSQKELYEETIKESKAVKSKESSLVKAKEEEVASVKTSVFTLHPNGERVESSLAELKPGYVYEIPPPNRIGVEKADQKKIKESLFFLAMNRTEINDGKMKYNIKSPKTMIAFSNNQYVPEMTAHINDTSYSILTGTVRFGIVMRFPYSLNELQLKVNDETYDGLTIRKKMLKEVKLLNNGDFIYVMEISEGLKKQSVNMLQAFINIKGVQLKYVQLRFYYDPEWSFSCQQVQFLNKEYVQIDSISRLDRSKKITKIDDTKLSLYLKHQKESLQVILNLGKMNKEKKKIAIREFENTYLYDIQAKQTMMGDDKEKVIHQLYACWSEDIKKFVGVLLKESGADSFIQNFTNDYLGFKDTFIGCLQEVDEGFIDCILSGLRDALVGKNTVKGAHKKYVAELIRILAAQQTEPTTQRYIVEALRAYQIPFKYDVLYGNIDNALYYGVPESAVMASPVVEKLLDAVSQENQILSLKLYKLATKFQLSEMDTITAVKNIQVAYPDKDSMSYYELVLSFKNLMMEKSLPNGVVDSQLFMYMFYHFATEYNKEIVCDFMNEIEKLIDKKMNEQEDMIMRKQLVLLAKNLGLDIFIKNRV